jgi:hypothetical protein
VNVGTLKEMLDDYGEHIPAIVILPDGSHMEITGLAVASDSDGMAACGIEID